jgi:hypothetical protein
MNISGRTLMAAGSSTLLRGQRKRVPSWKPKLGVLASYSEANLSEFRRGGGFTSVRYGRSRKA